MRTEQNFFRPEALGQRWGMSASSVRRLMYAGKLPAPIRISVRVFGWSLKTIEQIERDRDTAANRKRK